MIDGEKLRNLREQRGYTLTSMADRLGISPQCLHRAENEDRDFSLAKAAVAAYILKCRIEDFLKPVTLGKRR